MIFCHWTDRAGILTACPVPSRNIPEQPRDRREKEFKNVQLKRKVFFDNFGFFLMFFFVPGRSGTKEFVPGFFLVLLSRDKGTAGQGNLFCPETKGQWDKKTVLSQDKGTNGCPVPECSAGRPVSWKP